MDNPNWLTEIYIDVETLITSVESRPILWQNLVNTKQVIAEKRQAWLEISKGLYLSNADFDLLSDVQKEELVNKVKKKWASIKDRFQRSRKKQLESMQSSAATPPKKYVHEDLLEFLSRIEITPGAHRRTASSSSSVDLSANSTANNEADENGVDTSSRTASSNGVENATSNGVRAFSGTSCNRHLLFFHSLLPSLNEFNDEETIRFQRSVSQIILGVKNQRRRSSIGSSTLQPTSGQESLVIPDKSPTTKTNAASPAADDTDLVAEQRNESQSSSSKFSGNKVAVNGSTGRCEFQRSLFSPDRSPETSVSAEPSSESQSSASSNSSPLPTSPNELSSTEED